MLRALSILLVVSGFWVSNSSAAEPAIKHENIEWAQIWIPDNSRTDLPRVLLIGDSICNGYYDGVAKTLKGKAVVAKMATSFSLADPVFLNQVKWFLTTYKFAVIHFNNGLHGFDYTEAEYQKQFPELLKIIKESAPDAKLIWANSTPVRDAKDHQKFDPVNARVKVRNKIVAELAAKEGITVNDLYSLVENHPEYWNDGDGYHYKPAGIAVEAKQVAKFVSDALAK